MAGALLAAETIKLILGQPLSAVTDQNNVTYQFRKPASPVNAAGHLHRQNACPACTPNDQKTRIWQRRHTAALQITA